MIIEAFTQAKDPARPEANEDRLVVLPGRAYAVIDGVTARGPARHDGMLSGQFAATLIQRTLERGEPGDAEVQLDRLTAAIAAAYDRFGMTEQVRGDANPRFSATLALVLEQGPQIEILLVGDSGVRINGQRVLQVAKDLDGITAALRTAAWRHCAGAPAERERLARLVTFHGTRNATEWPPDALRLIEAEATAACTARFPHAPPGLVARLLQGGILNEQKAHQNNDASPLGYSCLDGFPVPPRLATRLVLDAADVNSIELFTDGYFAPGDAFGVASWERRFAEIEAEDPAKTGRYASVKGSFGTLFSDDRTYLGVRRRV